MKLTGAYLQTSMEEDAGSANQDSEEQSEPEWRVTDRERGIFTQNDRKYLLGQKDVDGQDERNTRYRIRQRAIQSLMDLALIGGLSRRDADRVFSDDRLSDRMIRDGAMLAVARLSRASVSSTEELESDIESVVTDAMTSLDPLEGETDDGGRVISEYDPTVSVELELELVNLFEAVNKILEKKELDLYFDPSDPESVEAIQEFFVRALRASAGEDPESLDSVDTSGVEMLTTDEARELLENNEDSDS